MKAVFRFTRLCLHLEINQVLMFWQHLQRHRSSKYGLIDNEAFLAFPAANCHHCARVTCADLAQAVLTCILCLPVGKLGAHTSVSMLHQGCMCVMRVGRFLHIVTLMGL